MKSFLASSVSKSNGFSLDLSIKFLAAARELKISSFCISNFRLFRRLYKVSLLSFVVLVTNFIVTPVERNLKQSDIKIKFISDVFVVYFFKASWAPGIAASSICKVPLKSIKTALTILIAQFNLLLKF